MLLYFEKILKNECKVCYYRLKTKCKYYVTETLYRVDTRSASWKVGKAMATIITIGNQKGGVGKTTTAVNLAAAYARLKKRVLLIDLDPQTDASKYLNHRRDNAPYMFDVFKAFVAGEEIDISAVIRRNNDEKVDYIPTDARLDMVDTLLAEVPFRETVLKQILDNPIINAYDYVFFDMSSRFASLLLNALVASDFVVIPVQPQEWSYDGITKMLANISAVKKSANSRLELGGILLNMCNRTVLSKSVIAAVKAKYTQYTLKTELPMLVEVPESQNARQSLVNTAGSKIGKMYLQCAKELIAKENGAK